MLTFLFFTATASDATVVTPQVAPLELRPISRRHSLRSWRHTALSTLDPTNHNLQKWRRIRRGSHLCVGFGAVMLVVPLIGVPVLGAGAILGYRARKARHRALIDALILTGRSTSVGDKKPAG